MVEHTTSPGTSSAATRRYEYSFPGGDETGRWPVLTETDPQGVGKRVHFDGLGRVAAEEAQDDVSGSSAPGAYRLVTERFYDVLGRTVSEKRHDWWWNAGQTARTETIHETRFEHDGWDRLRRTVFADGHAELTIHDVVARTVRTGIEGEGNILTVLDAFGNPLTSTQVHANGVTYATWRNQYDGFGRKISEQDALGNTTRYSYDLFDRVTERTLPENTQVRVQYADFSAHDLMVSLTVDGTSFGTRSYDGLGRVTTAGVGGRTTRYAYQGGGDKPSQVTTPKGNVLAMAYAPVLGGRLVGVTGPDVSSQYQLDGRTTALTQAKSGDFIQDLRYFASGLSRSSSEQAIPRLGRGSVTTSYAYSMAGRIQTFVDGSGNAHTREYDSQGRLKSCQQGNRRASFGYDAKSRPKSIVVEDAAQRTSLTTSLTYDDFGRETLRVTSGASSTRIETSYFANGQVSGRVTTEGGVVLRNESYVYDKRSRLQQYRCAGSQPPRDARGRAVLAQQFTFDKWSNITRRETTFTEGVEVTTYQFSAQDPTQLSAVVQNGQTIALAYDAAGNLTRDERGQELEYDSQNRLIRVRNSHGQLLSEYHYDAMGKLVAQSLPSGGHAQRYYQGEIVSNQTLDDRTITYLGAEGQYFAQEERQGATTRGQLFVTNREHSLVASVDAGSTEDVRYTPYGERSTSGEGRIVIGFNGESVDPVTGWYFLGNGYRVDNPTLMRFHSPDGWSPFGQGGVNPYVYSAGDPTGHLSLKAWLNIGLAVIGIAVGIVTLGAGAAVSAAAIAATTLGMASSAVSIAGAVLEDNEKASSILGWVSLGLGVASVGAGITAFARSTASVVSAGAKAAQTVKNEVAGITESLVSKSLAVSRGKTIAMAVEGIGHAADVVSKGTGIAANFVENEKIANILNWVSVGTGAVPTALGGGGLIKSGLTKGSTESPALHAAPTGSRASSSDVALLAARPLRADTPFRVSSDRFNNAYNILPISPHGLFRNAEIEVESLFVTRL
ncbi:hypothetical protein E8A74_14575 [Polyangium fumosum]|uniref:Teneurin-like YD-shell domain-containing protein n=1 Tax=Polyangium fumosum TaxID=889272 RepID=A0A4U1JCY8_9BACT|nr:hypothetical protein E8A74_14575 [Polyangium fumosum]